MQFEVERKFRVAQFATVEEKLRSLDAQFDAPVKQSDHYFAHPARNFAKTDEALRVRSVANQHVITYKGPKIDATTKTRVEIELPLVTEAETPDKFLQLLTALGFQPVEIVHKVRQCAIVSWQEQSVEVALDRVDHLGTFVELEISTSRDQVDSARQVLASLTAELNLTDEERRSYLELLLAAE